MSDFSVQYLVRFGRTDESAVKTVFMPGRKAAIHLANSLSFVFWMRHAFKAGEFTLGTLRVEQGEFWVELKQQPREIFHSEKEPQS